MNINKFTEFKFLSALTETEDQSIAAYVVSHVNLDKNRYESDIYLFDGNEHKIMTHTGKETQLSWLDNKTLLFTSKREEEKDPLSTDIYALPIDGGEAYLKLQVPLVLSKYRFLSNGDLVALALYHVDHPNYHRYDKNKREQIAKDTESNAFFLSIEDLPFYANGDTFTEKRRMRLVYIDAKTQQIQALTPMSLNLSQFDVNQDETKLYFLARQTKPIQALTQSLFEFNLQDKTLKQLSPKKTNVSGFELFKHEVIAYMTDHKKFGLNQNLVMAKLTEPGKLQMVYDPFYNLGNSINSDMRLYGSKSMGVFKDELVLNLTVEDHSRLVFFNQNLELIRELDVRGSCDGLCFVKGHYYMIAMTDQQLQEVTTLQGETLSSYNTEVLQNVYIAKPQAFTSYVNDRACHGWVLLPEDYDPKTTYPAILVIHGGPKTVYGEVYTHEMQVWVNAGYVVMYCNPVGSDGRGNEFADIRGQYGHRDYEDLMGFVDAVCASFPAIDQERLGVIGGSYGGYMTNWIISHTQRFKAAVSQRSICNWTSFYGVSDIGYFFVQDQVQADLNHADDHQKLWDNSPLKYVSQVKTPTLIIHSKLDYRCPVDQAYQWYASLKLRQVKTKLVLFHEENHDLTRSGKPKARIQSYNEVLNWFNQHLKTSAP
jgi:dipeptidyl aminopeptidase/acylaminoacyl peptidase